MPIEKRSIVANHQLRTAHKGQNRVVSGYAAMYNSYSQDLGGFRERIMPGAFASSMDQDTVCLVNHDPNQIIGRTTAGTLRLLETSQGMGYECDVPDTTAGRDVFTSIERGDICGSSFSFSLAQGDDEWSEEADENGVRFLCRTIKRVSKLHDVSPVTHPAYLGTNGNLGAGYRSAVEIPLSCPQEFRSLILANRESRKESVMKPQIKSEQRTVKVIFDEVRAAIASGKNREIYLEQRDETVGNSGGSIANSGNVGSFVPFEFFEDIKMAMKNYGALLNPDFVHYVETTHGRPMAFPTLDDTAVNASLIGEGASQNASEADAQNPNHQVPALFTYRGGYWRASIESFEDLDAGPGLIETFKRAQAQRIARRVDLDLVSGSGAGQPLGFLTNLVASYANAVALVAAGSSGNTGGSETGATSIGSQDMANLFFSVDAAYRNSPKCGWLMNDVTLQALTKVVTKQGVPLVSFEDGPAKIYGKPVFIDPNMPPIGSSAVTVAFGDFSFIVVRCASPRLKVYTETFADQGEVALEVFVRYSTAFRYQTLSGVPPIRLLLQHS